MVLINSPGFENVLVGMNNPGQPRQIGLYYRILDVDVNEVIKNAAVQLNVGSVNQVLAKIPTFSAIPNFLDQQ